MLRRNGEEHDCPHIQDDEDISKSWSRSELVAVRSAGLTPLSISEAVPVYGCMAYRQVGVILRMVAANDTNVNAVAQRGKGEGRRCKPSPLVLRR